ncbi:MAG: molecular chaperone TorD family protein [Coriobacteriaceae bacterium]|nr:molecular chaperone TorD family protein [Coriobacteriaceae bacterium]
MSSDLPIWSRTLNETWELRAQLYSFLGNSLLAPLCEDVSAEVLNPCFWQDFPLLPANEQMEEALSALADCTKRLTQYSQAEAQTAVNVEFTRLFIGPGKPSAPPWESLYRERAVTLFGRPTEEMRELYRRKGLRIERPGKQLEDHLGLELLYLAHCIDEVIAEVSVGKSPPTDELARIDYLREESIEQLAFIRKHPLWWIDRLFENATNAMSIGYYPPLIKLAWGVLLWDEALLTEFLQVLEHAPNSSSC